MNLNLFKPVNQKSLDNPKYPVQVFKKREIKIYEGDNMQEIYVPLIKLQKELNLTSEEAHKVYNNFSMKYFMKHHEVVKFRDQHMKRHATWGKYVDSVYLRPVRKFHATLNVLGLEDKIIGYAAKEDGNMAAHDLRHYKDLVKMFRDCPNEVYRRVHEEYHIFKPQVEEILGERLLI